jgi:hypothetical protein
VASPGVLPRLELPLALGMVALAAVWAQQTQAFQVFRYWDSDEYFLMAQQFASGEAITAASPYAYRVLTPWLVSRCCTDLQQGFLLINLAAGAALAVLLVVWLRHFISHAGVRLLMVAAYALQWHAPVRFVFYYPAYVDPLFQVFLLAALIAGERLVSRPTLIAGISYVVLTVFGTLARETMLMVPAAGLIGAFAARRTRGITALLWPARALITGLAAFAAVFLTLTGARAGYGFIDAVGLHLANKPIESIVLAWFIAFGPMVAIVAYDWRGTRDFLKDRVDLAALPLLCIGLAYVGGHDTERYLFWSMPVIYLLIGRSIERHRQVLLAPALLGVVVAGQVLAQRVLWAVPDPGSAVTPLGDVAGLPARLYAVANRVFVIDDFHWNLWSNFGSRPFHLVQLAFYLALSAVIVVLMQRRSVGRAEARPYESGVVA